MDEYSVMKCRFCGKLYRIYPHQVRKGDSSACHQCNEISGGAPKRIPNDTQKWENTANYPDKPRDED